MLFYCGVRAYSRLAYAEGGGLVFAVDNGAGRSFLRFGTFDEFESWYLLLPPDKRTINEVVTSDMRKLLLDIDSPEDAMLDKLLMYDFERHMTSRIHDVFFTLDIGTPKVAFYSMCSDNKLSYHAVVYNFMFSAKTCAGLCMIISSGQAWNCCVDIGVYKRVQFVRIESSTKFGETRWKKRVGMQGSLRDGILSDIKEVQVSGLDIRLQCNGRYKGGGPYCDISYINMQFKVGKTSSNGTVQLCRTRPGFCIQCNRVHDRENAFISYVAGRRMFTCWRYCCTQLGVKTRDKVFVSNRAVVLKL